MNLTFELFDDLPIKGHHQLEANMIERPPINVILKYFSHKQTLTPSPAETNPTSQLYLTFEL